jgi:hypothetical protein
MPIADRSVRHCFAADGLLGAGLDVEAFANAVVLRARAPISQSVVRVFMLAQTRCRDEGW